MNEFDALRNELDHRMNIFYEHFPKILNFIIILWGIALSLLTTLANVSSTNYYFFLLIPTLFLLSVIILFHSSEKDHENLNQVFKIAAYLIVFVEQRTNDAGKYYSWETINAEMLSFKKNDFTKTINREFTTLGIIAIILNTLFSFSTVTMLLLTSKYDYNLLSACIIILFFWIMSTVLSIFFVMKIYKNNTIRSFTKTKNNYIVEYLNYAKQNGILTEDDITKIFNKKFIDKIYEDYNN